MRDSDNGIRSLLFLQKNIHDRFADDVASSHHHDMFPRGIVAASNEQLLDAYGSAWLQTVLADDKPPHIDRMKPVDVFPVIDCR